MGTDALDSFKLEDRTAILTGPFQGVNQAIAGRLAQMGCDVAFVHHEVDRARRFAEQLMDAREAHDRYGRAIAIQASIGSPAQAQDAISRAAEALGGIDVFIDGGFGTAPGLFREPSTLAALDEAIDFNLRGPLLMAQSMMRFMENRKRGRMIFLLHDLARIGVPGHSILSATRMGLTAFARTLARELAEKNVTVNCVAMGITEEFLLSHQTPPPPSIQAAYAELSKSYPGAPNMEPERIANVVAFLASPLSSGVTGQTIAASQGLSFLS